MSVVVHQGDWSLDRKGPADQQRHQQQLQEAIRKNLPELIADESIVAQNGKAKVKIPLRSRQQYHFRFDWEGKNKVGQGGGASKVGDSAGGKQQPASGSGGNGDDPGEEIYEAEVAIDQIEEALFSQLELPDLQEKEEPAAAAPAVEFTDIRKVGISSNIDKRKTLFNALLRNAKAGQKSIGQLLPQDLRFKTWEEKPLPLSAAVVFAVMDISGSMGLFQKRAARNFFFWTTRFLKTKYQQVEIVYIVHTTQARQVSAQQFFTLGESGGTVCSSAYELVYSLIQQRYPPQRYNNYLLHVSDGENYTPDNAHAATLLAELSLSCQMIGLLQVVNTQTWLHFAPRSGLWRTFEKVGEAHPGTFRCAEMSQMDQLYDALRSFFSARDAQEVHA